MKHDQDLRPLIARVWNARAGKFQWAALPRYSSSWTGTHSTSHRHMALANAHCDKLNRESSHD